MIKNRDGKPLARTHEYVRPKGSAKASPLFQSVPSIRVAIIVNPTNLLHPLDSFNNLLPNHRS